MHKEYTENRVIFQDYVVVQNIGLVDGQVMGHVMHVSLDFSQFESTCVTAQFSYFIKQSNSRTVEQSIFFRPISEL